MNEIFGMISIFLASSSSSTAGMFAKLASTYIHTFDLTLIRMTSQVVIVSVFCYIFHISPLKEQHKKQQITRGLLGSVSFTLGLYGNTNMEMSNCTILKFVGKLFTILLARFYLKEKISILKISALLLGFFGVFLVAKPSFVFGSQIHEEYPMRNYAVIATILGALTLSVSTILTKTIVNKVHVLSLIWYFSIVSLFSTLPLQFFKETSSVLFNLHYVVFMVIFYLCSQLLQNAGLKTISASVVTLIQISDTLFGVMYGVYVFNETLDAYSKLGCICVLSVNFLLVLEKFYESQKFGKVKDYIELSRA
eukprot:NODE_100_length_20777_cov_0.240884.p5 type:complete len:308 gc:universal NODE_100_length_20777_cov_0.240884:961-1884(+)